jgi:hypothetical protein
MLNIYTAGKPRCRGCWKQFGPFPK